MAPQVLDTQKIVSICRDGGAVRVALFGFTARGEARHDRDVDLVTEGAISPYLRDRIQREQRVLDDA